MVHFRVLNSSVHNAEFRLNQLYEGLNGLNGMLSK